MNNIEKAVQCFNGQNFLEAEKIALEIYKSDNNNIDAIDVLAAIYLRTGTLDIIKNLNPQKLALIRKLAEFLTNLQTYEQASFFYQKAVELDKNDIVGLNNLALMYEKLEKNADAENTYKKSLQIKENYPALYNLGVLYRKLKNLEKSEFYLKKALSMQPENLYANYSLGMTYLMGKNFQKGYPYFLRRPIQQREMFHNFWDGSKHPESTLLVFCEYGFGDAIMFSRYFPFLKNYFAKIKVCAQKPLIELFEASFDGFEFISDINNQDYDFCTFIMDLPYLLNMDFNHIPFADGYLYANAEKVQYFKENFFQNDLKKIGLFYIGGELQKRNAKYRMMPLAQMEKLFSIDGAKFYSVQKEDLFDELKDYPQIVNLGETFKDFSDTAAAIKNLDLLITIDSAPVHLAGAIGAKTILMLPYYSEWRWFNDTNTTPWYNSVEIIRQTTPCRWQSVVDEIYKKL